MTEGGHDDYSFSENVEEDLHKLFIHTVLDAGIKGSILGPDEVIEEFVMV